MEGIWSFTCVGCSFAKYGERKAAKKAGRTEVPVNEGPAKYIKLLHGQIVGQSGAHHPQCFPKMNAEVAVDQIQRKEMKSVEKQACTPWNVNVEVCATVIALIYCNKRNKTTIYSNRLKIVKL